MTTTKKNKNFLIFFLSLNFILSTYYLTNKYFIPIDHNFGEWMINYEGGFIRRGLSGQFFIILSDYLNLNLRLTIYFFLVSVILIYLFLINNFFKGFNFSYLLAFFVLCPLFFNYYIFELEGLARKEILLLVFYLIYLKILENNFNFSAILFLLFFPIILLIWEVSFLFIPFFIFVGTICLKNYNYKNFVKIVLILLPSICIFGLIFFSKATSEQIKVSCEAVNNCTAAFSYLDKDIKYMLDRIDFKITYIFRYSFVFLLCFLPLIYFYKKCKNNENNFILNNKVLILLLINFPSLILFVVSEDWGRWISLIYSFNLFTIFYLIKRNFLSINFDLIDNYFAKYKIITIVIIFFYCFSWNPKILYSDDIGSLPMYRSIYKAIKHNKQFYGME